MGSADNINGLMKSIQDKRRQKSIISAKINELNEKKELLVKEFPTLEEELSFWQKDLLKLKKNNQSVDDLQVWNDEIDSIQLQIQKKKKEIEENEKQLINEFINEKKAKENIEILILDIKNQIFTILKSKDYLIQHSKNELIILTEILKEVIKSDSELEIDTFIDIISKEGVEISLDYLELINRVFGENLIILPNIIPKFISDYLNNFKTGTLLDPWPLNGFMLKSLSVETQNKDLITYQTESTVFKAFFKDEIEICSKEVDLNYDFIVGYPPFNNGEEINYDLKYNISGDKASLNFLKMALKIKDDGEGLFILDYDFLLKRKKESVLSNLNTLGLYIKSIIQIPFILVPDEKEKILLIISKKPQKNIFVGTLSNDLDTNNILKDNLINKQKGKIPQYGYITSLNCFFTFKSLYAHIESLKISKELNFPIKQFCEIIAEINLPLNNSQQIDKPNSLYFPLEETLKVEVNPEKINATDYIQLVLNPETCLAEYIATYLNDTVLGRKIKESINLGPYTSSLFQEVIFNTELYIPDLDSQVEVLRVDSQISEVAAKATNYREQLWKKPNEHILILEEIELLDDKNEYHFEKWVESLPYPLASILWESFSTSKPDLKVKYLLHFFEAFSEFNVIILLSGLITDDRFFNQEFSRCTQFNPKFKKWFNNPSFGNWNFFGQCLARNLQYILRKQYKRNQLLNIFGSSNPDFLSKISSYELYDILSEVNRYRNSWDAHGPVVSTKEYENRFKILRNSISKLYNCLGNIFNTNMFVLPLDSTYKEGIHYYTAKKFMGSRNRFVSIEVETMAPMDTNDIYLIMDNNRKPIKLLPLIKTCKNSCYFYNSLIKDKYKTQFVSYHNKEKPEILCPSEELESFYLLFENDKYY